MSEKVKANSKQIGIYEKFTLKDGKTSFKKQLHLGIDVATDKEVVTAVSAKSFAELKEKSRHTSGSLLN
ncbi:MAG: hypothetical protein FWF59_13200 [Turicibacter sp.]|nr:hypothetical protein [Turicibacter sp.]